MLAELEQALIDALKASPLASRVRQIDSLPGLEGESLVGRFQTDAPAVYVALGSFPLAGGYVRPKFGIACVARNHRGQVAARHGDGVMIGLYPMVEAVIAALDRVKLSIPRSGVVEDVSIEVTGVDLVTSEALFAKGVFAAVVQLQTVAEIDFRDELTDLADFKTFHADYDIDNQHPAVEHDKWLLEPPDHSTAVPPLDDTLLLPE